jgi:hypothetical protein
VPIIFLGGYCYPCFENIYLSVNLNFEDGQFRRFAASKRHVNGVEIFISEYYRTTFLLAVPKFAARISGVFAYVEAYCDEILELLKTCPCSSLPHKKRSPVWAIF